MTLTDLFVEKTVSANAAKTAKDRLWLCAERSGIGQAIELLYGDTSLGNAMMAADRYYIDRGDRRNMTGGVWHNWQPEHTHVNRGDGTDICKECGEDLRHECHRRIA